MTVLREDEFQRILESNPDLQAENPGLLPLAGEKPAPTRKWHNMPQEFNGRVFSSKREADYARLLTLQQKAGEIICWAAQVPVDIGNDEKYVMDFLVIDNDWNPHIVDSKGSPTRDYLRKKKMFEKRFGRKIEEV